MQLKRVAHQGLCLSLVFLAGMAIPDFSVLAETAGTGAITGTISDSSGAAIPGAAVEANPDMGQRRQAATAADGT